MSFDTEMLADFIFDDVALFNIMYKIKEIYIIIKLFV